MLKLVKPRPSGLPPSIKLCYRVVMLFAHSKQLKGKTFVPQLLFSSVSVSETEETTSLYENCPTTIV